MKTKAILLFLSTIFFVILQGCSSGYYDSNGSSGNEIQNNEYSDNSANQQYNVDDLNQYGDWVNVNPYGRVWRPSVNPGWQPFVNGHWAYDGNDWVWISYEPFGWMVYHYGSWDNTPDYGWVWIPDNDAWSPACVQWIYYGDQVGWAPRRPQSRNWSEPWDQNNLHPWVMVPMEDFNKENVVTYRVNNISRVSNDQSIRIERRQPDLNIVQSRVREPIKTVKIERDPVLTPPVLKNPVDPKRPVDRNPGEVNPTPPVTRNPNNTDTRPPNRNLNNPKTTPPKPIYHMQIPPQERQKVDKYRPKVEKDALRKKAPVNKNNQPNKPDKK